VIPEAADHAAEVEAWRRRRRERLTGEDGWLSLTGLFWLAEGSNAVGAGPDAAVRLPAGAPDRLGTIDLSGQRAVFAPATPIAPGLAADGKRLEGPIPLRADGSGAPTAVSIGSIRFHLLERGGRLAARVRDRENPLRFRLGPIPASPWIGPGASRRASSRTSRPAACR